jgi:hypothetical protein
MGGVGGFTRLAGEAPVGRALRRTAVPRSSVGQLRLDPQWMRPLPAVEGRHAGDIVVWGDLHVGGL